MDFSKIPRKMWKKFDIFHQSLTLIWRQEMKIFTVWKMRTALMTILGGYPKNFPRVRENHFENGREIHGSIFLHAPGEFSERGISIWIQFLTGS